MDTSSSIGGPPLPSIPPKPPLTLKALGEKIAYQARERQVGALWKRLSEDKRFSSARKEVAVAVLKMYLDDGNCQLTLSKLADAVGWAHNTVQRTLGNLIRFGYLRKSGLFFNSGIELIMDANAPGLPFAPLPAVTYTSQTALFAKASSAATKEVRSAKVDGLANTIDAAGLDRSDRSIARIVLWHFARTGAYLTSSRQLSDLSGYCIAAVSLSKAAVSSRGWFSWNRAGVRHSGPLIPILTEANMSLPRQHDHAGYSMTLPSELGKFRESQIGHNGVGVFNARCSKCNATMQVGNFRDYRLHPDAVSKLFEKKGWRVRRAQRTNLCPACARPQPKITEASTPTTPVTETTMTQVPPTPPAVAAPPLARVLPRELTKPEIRMVFPLLDTHFDENNGHFERGWDDERVAVQCKVPPASVAKFREETFGKLRAFEDIEKALADIAIIKTMAEDLQRQVIEIRNKRMA